MSLECVVFVRRKTLSAMAAQNMAEKENEVEKAEVPAHIARTCSNKIHFAQRIKQEYPALLTCSELSRCYLSVCGRTADRPQHNATQPPTQLQQQQLAAASFTFTI